MTDTFHILLIVCPMMFLASFIDSIAGGGGLISLPAFLAAGLPPHIASGTNKCAATFGNLVSMIKYRNNKSIHYFVAIPAAAMALIGSPIGSKINMLVDEKILSMIMVAAVPVIAVFLIFKKDFGATDTSDRLSRKKMLVLSLIIGFVIGMYDGFFGPGTGTFLALCFTTFMGFDLIQASGNAKVVNFASNVSSFVTFAIYGKILWTVGLPAAVFGIAGSYIGASFAIKKGTKFIRPMFFVVLCLLIGKLIFDFLP